MDLLEILHESANTLPQGLHTPGLQSIVQQVKSAFGHLERGQREKDDTAFADVIYRTNQAFEGSLKEAYRVLGSQDPERARPFDIERYFSENAILRPRVLRQLSAYRTEWRNPSTHDYKLDFDESEAVLAIITVCGFAIVLFDQIAGRLSYVAAQRASVASQEPVDSRQPLLDTLAALIVRFRMPNRTAALGNIRESELVGALAGFLSSQMRSITVTDAPVVSDVWHMDLIARRGNEEVLIDVTRGGRRIAQRLEQIRRYMGYGAPGAAILFTYSSKSAPNYAIAKHRALDDRGRILVITCLEGHVRLTHSLEADSKKK